MIIHVDMDAFYAAVEQREQPELVGLPVIVGADPRGRGVVSTCSYEARVYGVRSAMPIGEAYRRCPQGVYLPVRMELYCAVSQTVMEILDSFSPLVEPLSIDEAFVDAAGLEGLFGPPEQMAERIKAEIRARTKLTCSVGVAPNKFLAKLATELGKPDGLTVIAPERVQAVLDPLSVQRVFGVGRRTSALLESLGIHTIGQLRLARPDALTGHVSVQGLEHMQRLARGEDDRIVEAYRNPKQMSAERTFMVDIASAAEIRKHLLELAQDVGHSLRRRGFRARSVRLKLRTEDFVTSTRTRSLARATDSDRVLYRTACELFNRTPPRRRLRLVGVAAADLRTGPEEEQGTLFGPPPEEVQQATIERTVDRIRDRFGLASVRPAALLDRRPPRKRSR
jgi:DNA polymerase-4